MAVSEEVPVWEVVVVLESTSLGGCGNVGGGTSLGGSGSIGGGRYVVVMLEEVPVCEVVAISEETPAR